MNRVLFEFGFITIYWYSVFILLAIIFASSVIIREAKRKELSKDFTINLIFWCIIIGFIGARLYYVAFNYDLYRDNPLDIFKVWEGGLAIHGGLIAGFLMFLIYTTKYKVNKRQMLDMSCVGLLLGQAIGRWGNFFNGEAHGPATTYAALKGQLLPEGIIKGMKINGTYYYPTFFYEFLWDLVGFIILFILMKTNKRIKRGQLTSMYLIWYSIGRFAVESMRTDSLMLGNLKMAQIFSGCLFIIGIIYFIKCSKGSRFDNLYNDTMKPMDTPSL